MVRGFIINGWRHEDIADLFVSSGRIWPIPGHYELVGSIDDYWPQASALGLRLSSSVLHVNDRVAYEQPVDFLEEEITSLQLNGQKIDEAHAGDYVGVSTSLTKQQARTNVRVYRVKPRKAKSEG